MTLISPPPRTGRQKEEVQLYTCELWGAGDARCLGAMGWPCPAWQCEVLECEAWACHLSVSHPPSNLERLSGLHPQDRAITPWPSQTQGHVSPTQTGGLPQVQQVCLTVRQVVFWSWGPGLLPSLGARTEPVPPPSSPARCPGQSQPQRRVGPSATDTEVCALK